jgi:hypothetical protein
VGENWSSKSRYAIVSVNYVMTLLQIDKLKTCLSSHCMNELIRTSAIFMSPITVHEIIVSRNINVMSRFHQKKPK